MLIPLFILSLPATGVSAGPANAPLAFLHPRSNDVFYQERDEYFINVLRLALQKSGEPFTLDTVLLSPMSEKRSKLFLKSQRYNVHWLLTNEELEEDLIPIRVPLYKGLIGWRLLVVHENNADVFANITTLSELKPYKATQGLGWPDTIILESAGLSLRPAVDWTGLMEIMTRQQAEYMPLALNEVWWVKQSLNDRQLMIEDHLILQYPSAYYFFVSKNLPEHARLLEKGMQAAVNDGSFTELFMRTFGDGIRRSNLQDRTIFSLNNPLLPRRTPVADKRLWFKVEDLESPTAQVSR